MNSGSATGKTAGWSSPSPMEPLLAGDGHDRVRNAEVLRHLDCSASSRRSSPFLVAQPVVGGAIGAGAFWPANLHGTVLFGLRPRG
jgi:hypothetical protein